MEGEKQIAEAVCDAAEEWAARNNLFRHRRGDILANRISEAPMMEGFNETDATNLQRVKDAMAEKAVGGSVLGGADAAAAAAFAALLDAETRRAELAAKSQGQDKASPAAGASWTQSVAGRSGNLEALAPAA